MWGGTASWDWPRLGFQMSRRILRALDLAAAVGRQRFPDKKEVESRAGSNPAEVVRKTKVGCLCNDESLRARVSEKAVEIPNH